jgi:hypothetical protein
MSSFNDQFLLSSLRNEDYQQQQLAAELLHAQAAELELGSNPNAMAIRRPFDPVAHDLVRTTFSITVKLESFEM